MPRYRQEDDGGPSGVHRRRFERKGSNTPIIVGGVVVGVALIVVLILVLGGKKDPEADKAAAKAVAANFLRASLDGNRESVFRDLIDPTGARGWINVRLQKELAKSYRMWNHESLSPEQKAKNAELRKHQDDRMWSEISAIAEKMKLVDHATIKGAVDKATVDIKMTFVYFKLRHMGGSLLLVLGPSGETYKVQFWEVLSPAP